MEPHILIAVVFAAALHAGWNAMVKIESDRLVSVTIISAFQGLTALLFIPFVGFPNSEVLPWLALSIVLHTGYKIFLARAYDAGEMGQVYPIARGTAPLLVTIAGFVFLREHIPLLGVIGIVVICAGIVSLSFGRSLSTLPHSSRAVGLALTTAFFVAGYTVVDGVGVRNADVFLSYAAWLFFLDGIVLCLITACLRGQRSMALVAANWRPGIVAGAMSAAAYGISMWAMTKAPIALVAAARETSVLFAALLSVVILRERPSLLRILGIAGVFVGMLALNAR